jgi:TatD DNase family protein
MNLIDSHIHLDFPAFDRDRNILLKSAAANSIKHFVVPATTSQSWQTINDLAKTYPCVSPAYGIHPYFIHAHTLYDCEKLDTWLSEHDCIAVGETGLDYYLKELDQTLQMAFFEAQLKLANKHQLPVILHARKAVEIVTNTLKKHSITKGIVHSFNGSYQQAMRLIDMGFKLGFGGAITYPRATRLRALIKQLPIESICLETDAPDQPIIEFQGQRNQPIALLSVLNTVAELRSTEPGDIAKNSTRNTLSVFNIC